MKKALTLFLLIIILTINACAPLVAATPAPLPATEPAISVVVAPSQIPTVEERNLTLSLDILRFGVYHSPDWGEFQLSDGIYYRTPPTSQESPENYTTRLLENVLYGDLNLDGLEDAVVFIYTQNGGTGRFVEMAAVLNLNGSARNISTLYLGDRVIVESGAVQDGLITLNLRVQGPNDGLCCPSQIVTWNFHLDNGQLVQISSATPLPNTPIPSTQAPSWNVYNNQKYGYSLGYPGFYNAVAVSDEYVEIGDKIVVAVWNMDPTAPLGDGPVIESTTDVQLSGYPAKLLTGYIGSVGGNIPQQFRRFVVERNGSYFVITLYALGLHATEGDVSQIAQLNPKDISLFDNMVTSMQIP